MRGIAWAMLAVVVLAPVFLGWYSLWALPLFAVSLGALWQERLERPLGHEATRPVLAAALLRRRNRRHASD